MVHGVGHNYGSVQPGFFNSGDYTKALKNFESALKDIAPILDGKASCSSNAVSSIITNALTAIHNFENAIVNTNFVNDPSCMNWINGMNNAIAQLGELNTNGGSQSDIESLLSYISQQPVPTILQ